MAIYYFDSSALVKRYRNETGSAWVMGLTAPASGNALYVARITGAEVVSAIVRAELRGDLTQAAAAAAIQVFQYDLANQYQVIEITPLLIERAMSLAETHALRGYDSVHLGAALEVNDRVLALGLPALTLISADQDLNQAALAEGLTVDDPNNH
jgi:predicted nucleic acid-binding protein